MIDFLEEDLFAWLDIEVFSHFILEDSELILGHSSITQGMTLDAFVGTVSKFWTTYLIILSYLSIIGIILDKEEGYRQQILVWEIIEHHREEIRVV